MRIINRQRRVVSRIVLVALFLGQLAGVFALPRPAAAALSADPNEEIIYVDNTGVIRVLDTQGDPLVQWFSPDGSWDEIKLLDVQGDGDLEILAIDDQENEAFRVVLYDPVVAFGSSQVTQRINGIPWEKLWEYTNTGDGEVITGGNFDPGIPGDEIVVGYVRGTTSHIEVWNASTLGSDGRPTGRDWKIHIAREYIEREYSWGFPAQVTDEGADMLVLIDDSEVLSRMDAYRPDQDMLLVDDKNTDTDRFRRGVAGQIDEGGREEVAVFLTSARPNRDALRIYEMSSAGLLSEERAYAFAPNPEALFLADIRGNGDDEVFVLRNWPEGEEGARLIMRDEWGDDERQNENLIEWELMEGGDKNEFRTGAGGDVDGDGRDEIILLRDDRIRVYHRPETGGEGSSNYNDYMLTTDNERTNLLAGDLDRLGFTTGPILMVSGNMVDATIPAGTVSQDYFISVSNVGTDGGVGVNAIIPPGNNWAQVNPTFGTTPVNFRVRFNAANLNPGTYDTTMTLIAQGTNVGNNNYVVYLRLNVVPPVLDPEPGVLSLYRLPCENDPCSPQEVEERSEPFSTTVRINGTTNLAFRAAILGVPEPPSGTTVTTSGLTGPITSGRLDERGNIVVSDDFGNSRTLASEQVSAAAALSTTVYVDPELTWITTATLDSEIVPADLTIAIDPAILTEELQREHAVLILVADTRAGTPNGNVTLVPIELANVGHLLWMSYLSSE